MRFRFRSTELLVPAAGAGGVMTYFVDLDEGFAGPNRFSRRPSVLVSVEGSSTVRAVVTTYAAPGHNRMAVTLRNDHGAAQPVRFNLDADDQYHQG